MDNAGGTVQQNHQHLFNKQFDKWRRLSW